jgi:DNA-binding CsgD family transcriptional regulator
MICLGFHRAHEAEPFCGDEVRQLQSLAPLIQSVICNLAHREAVTLSGTILDTVCDCHAGLGFVILDDDLLVRHANRRGLMQLGLYESGGQGIQAASVFGELRQRLLDVGPGAGQGGRFTLPVSQPNIPMPLQLDVDVRALRASDSRTYYLLVTSERSDRKRLDDCCDVFGLSERQSDVARLVCAGHSNAQISRTLGITLRTVENHLRSIYTKLAVNNRMQLVSKVLGLN